MQERPRLVRLRDGRHLSYAVLGDPAGSPVIFMHGFPSSRIEAALYDAPARAAGAMLVAPDRPGFGQSDFRPDRRLLDWPEDVADLADALGQDRVRIVGGSAGCPYALACGHRLPDRVIAIAIVAGLGPMTDRDLLRRMGPPARLAFALATRAPGVFRTVFGTLARLVARYPGLNFHLNRATPPDRAVLARPEVRALLERSVGEAFRQGTAGAVHELALLASPWGFDVGEVTVPIGIWHGREDGVVPLEMGRALSRLAPNARLREVADEGHVSLPLHHGKDILETLMASR